MIYVTVTTAKLHQLFSGENYQCWILGKLSKSHLQINMWDILCQSGKLAWSQRKEFTLLKYLLYFVAVWWVSYQLLHILQSHLWANFSPAMVMRLVAGAQKGFLLVLRCSIELLLSPFPPASCCSVSAVTLASLFTSQRLLLSFVTFSLTLKFILVVLVLLPVPLWLSALPSSPSPVSSHHSSLCACCQPPPLSALLQSVGFFLFLQ